MSKCRNLFFATVCLAFVTSHCLAGPIEDAAKQAETSLADGKFSEAWTSIENARNLVWSAMPLALRNATFVSTQPKGYGIYDIRPNNSYKQGVPLLIYFEPQGYGFGRDGEFYTIDLSIDFDLRSADGESLLKSENVETLKTRSLIHNYELLGTLTYTFTGLPPGEYEVVTTAHDKNTNKQADFSLKFNIIP